MASVFEMPPVKKRRPAVPVFAFAASSAASPAPPAASPAPPAAAPLLQVHATMQSSDAEASSSTGSSSSTGERSQGAAAAPAESSPESKAETAANGANESAAGAATLSKPAEDAEKTAVTPATSSKLAEDAETSAAASACPSPGSEQAAPAKGTADALSEKRQGTATAKSALAQLQQLGPTQVYGFEAGLKNEAKGKAIALRLEPLKPGLPEFERVLGENRQSILIGSNRSKVDVNVADDVVSKKHVSLSLIGIKGELALCITDHSTNGSYINGTRLPGREKKFRIRSGDKLTLKAPGLDEDFGWKLDFGNTVAFFTRG